jgi:hypothetical protein
MITMPLRAVFLRAKKWAYRANIFSILALLWIAIGGFVQMNRPVAESDEDESRRPIVVAFEIPFFAVSAAPSTSNEHAGRRSRGERLDLRREDTALWAP